MNSIISYSNWTYRFNESYDYDEISVFMNAFDLISPALNNGHTLNIHESETKKNIEK